MEGNASVYQVYPVNTGEGRANGLRTLGPGFEQEGAGGGVLVYATRCTNLIDEVIFGCM